MVDENTEGTEARIGVLVAEMRGILEAIQNLKPELKPYADAIEKEIAGMAVGWKFDTPDVCFGVQDARDYGEKLGITMDYVDKWHSIYPFAYYDTMQKRRCIGWKESLEAFAAVVKSLKGE